MNTKPLRAVVAAHSAAAVAASAPLTVATVVAPAPLGTPPVLRMLTPLGSGCSSSAVGSWNGACGTLGPRKQPLTSSNGPIDEGS